MSMPALTLRVECSHFHIMSWLFARKERDGSMVDRAHAWQAAGQYFTWYPQGRRGDALQIFYRCLGDPTSPAIVLLHGWPTSSYDFRLLAYDLSTDHYVC